MDKKSDSFTFHDNALNLSLIEMMPCLQVLGLDHLYLNTSAHKIAFLVKFALCCSIVLYLWCASPYEYVNDDQPSYTLVTLITVLLLWSIFMYVAVFYNLLTDSDTCLGADISSYTCRTYAKIIIVLVLFAKASLAYAYKY